MDEYTSLTVKLSDFRYSLELHNPIHLIFENSAETEGIELARGTLFVRTSGVKLSGLKIIGNVIVDDNVTYVTVDNSSILGSLKLGKGCKHVSVSNTIFSHNGRGVGLFLSPGCECKLFDCRIHDCLVGISVVTESQKAFDSINPACLLEKCEFSRNTTDLMLQLQLRVRDDDDSSSIDASKILDLHDMDTDLRIEVSISGRFAEPLSFRSWPIPLDLLPHSLPRRGHKANGRFCHISVSGTFITVKEDVESTGGAPNGSSCRKRKVQSTARFTKAEEYYSSVLRIDPGSSKEAVVSAFKKLALEYHPDKAEQSSEQFILVKKARDELMRLLQRS